MNARSRLAAFAALGLLSGCGSTSAQAEPSSTPGVVTLHSRPDAPSAPCRDLDVARPAAGTEAPETKRLPKDVELGCLGEGGVLPLANLRGPAILNVWASWCRPCGEEMPFLVEAEAAVGDAVRFVGLNLADEPADARTWNSYFTVGWPSLRDPDAKIRGPLRVPGPPVTFFIRSDGGVAGVHYGAFTSTGEVREALTKYLGVASSAEDKA
ncbi:MAG: TlpA family protein disulfide reductase [Sporichthyaceae bacterium]